jgi:hypothetical protein
MSIAYETYCKLVCELARYFSTIDPQFVDMKPGYVEKNNITGRQSDSIGKLRGL